jgi:mannan endo-1,4-beta-mannosidase
MFLFCLVLLIGMSADRSFAFEHFIKARGDQLVDGEKPFRFISFNIPNLLVIEDNVLFAEINPWRLPDKFELTDALATVRELGGNVARTYVITVKRTNDTAEMPRHVLGPGKFNEKAFRALDLALQTANEQGIRLIIPLVDNWSWQGGRAEYAGFRGKTKEEFWTDPQLIADFKETIRFILTRTNTLTGVRYADDKAVLCWETGNEIDSPPAWTREIAAYIKSLDTNHLVMDGFNSSQLRSESLEMPEIDLVTTHHYPGQLKSFEELIRENWAKAKGRKPYVVGEFGFVSTEKMEAAINAISETGTAGGLLWSLRFRNRDGGFYWHSEPFGGNQYKAFHWPPSEMGKPYDEQKLMTLVRARAFEIRGMKAPPISKPAAPKLLSISDVAAISWRGSVGATRYNVERASDASGPWKTVGDDIDEAFVQYRPLFADSEAPAGRWFYRVRAKNGSGISEPSNVVGPVTVAGRTLVDELANFSKVEVRVGNIQIKERDCRQAKEDAHRAAGQVGDAMIYRLPHAVDSFRVYAFFPTNVAPLKFSTSLDGRKFSAVVAQERSFFQGQGDYGYWKPVLFSTDKIEVGARFLKIEFTGEAQIGRIEIHYELGGK